MRRLLLAFAAAALAAAPAASAPEEAVSAPAAHAPAGPAAAGVPILQPLAGALDPAASAVPTTAPEPSASPDAALAELLPAPSAQPAARAAEAKAQAGNGNSAAAPRTSEETLSLEESVRFDGAAKTEGAVEAVLEAPETPARGAELTAPARRAPARPAAPRDIPLVLAERAVWSVGAFSVLAVPALAFLALGTIGFAGFVLALTFTKRARRRKPLTLPAEEQKALLDRAAGRLDALIVKLGLPPASAPVLKLSNDDGRFNMTARGRRISRRAVIQIGEDWAGFTDEEMDGVLAHELAHMYRADSEKDFTGRGLADALALTGAALAPVTAFIAWAAWMDPQPVDDIGRLAAGWAASPHGGALALMVAVAGIGGALLLLLSSRLRERLADRFSARLVGPAGLIAFFQRLSAKPLTRWQRLRRRLGLTTHPSDPARIRYLRKFPRA